MGGGGGGGTDAPYSHTELQVAVTTQRLSALCYADQSSLTLLCLFCFTSSLLQGQLAGWPGQVVGARGGGQGWGPGVGARGGGQGWGPGVGARGGGQGWGPGS